MKKLLFTITLILFTQTFAFCQNENNSPLPDYEVLAKACQEKLSPGCCMSSVKAMEEGQYLQDMGDTFANTTCPEGFQPNMMKCPDSYRWCIPEIKKEEKTKTK